MMLYIRMALYLVFGVIAGQGLGVFDPEAGTITIQIDDLTTLLSGVVGYAGTFIASRVAKSKGGAT